MGHNRDMGIEFGDLQDDLEAGEYPLTAEELLERYGERRVEHANGSVTLRELLGESTEAGYGSADEVRQAVLNMVGDGAEGRKAYTDREQNATGLGYEQQSF